MEGTSESDIAQCDNNALAADSLCTDNNEPLNVDCKDPTSTTPSKNDIVDDVVCGKPEDEQLLNLTVLDDDSLNQLPAASIIETEKSLEAEPEATVIKEDVMSEDTNTSENKPTAKAPESDSLILTADDELETEMFLSEKDKNDKLDKEHMENSKKFDIESTTEKHKNISAETTYSSANGTDNKIMLIEHTNKTDCKSSYVFGSRFLWVANITPSIKATELKQFISKVGKVVTAKIVTDGKKCYGYVVMDNNQDANQCLKILNNTMFEGRKITVSFTRPSTGGNIDKTKESATNDDKKSKLNNETDDTKYSKSKDRSTVHKDRDLSKTRSSSVRRRRSRDPLTTKFGSKDKFYRRRSRSVARNSNDFLRDKLERDRLRRRILEEQRRGRDEMMREMHREEKQRELEFKLERERKKLQFERELFERERRELYRLDAERRKIEKERLEVMRERSKLEKEFQKNRTGRKNDDFNLSSTIVKPQESLKVFEKSIPKGLSDSNFRKMDNKHDRPMVEPKNVGGLAHRIGLKDDFKLGKDNRERSKSRRGDDDRAIPPPPNLSADFDLSAGRKLKHQDFKRDLHADRKVDHGGRKIEVIDRKYYSDRSHENADRKNEGVYRKPDFDDRKTYAFNDRKYEYGRDAKRSRIGEFPPREPAIRNQWLPSTNYTEPWKTSLSTAVNNSPLRYQDSNFSTQSYGGANRVAPVYYHSGSSTQEYQRYDHCSQNNARKY